VRDFYDALRSAGASARNALEHAAAGKWGVPEEECQGQNHFVVHAKTGRKLSYGELVPLASASTAPTQNTVRFKRPEQFRYIGTDIPLIDLRPITNRQSRLRHRRNSARHGLRVDRAPAISGDHAKEL
jgi:isoquinoline 1-oxidoreductase beta subunit